MPKRRITHAVHHRCKHILKSQQLERWREGYEGRRRTTWRCQDAQAKACFFRQATYGKDVVAARRWCWSRRS